MLDNNHKVLMKCRYLGITITNVDPDDLTKCEKKYLVLGVVWQLVRVNMRIKIAEIFKMCDINKLLLEGEGVEDLLGLLPEDMLLRWFNYHLTNAGHSRRVRNYDRDLQDSVNYLVLLHQLEPEKCAPPSEGEDIPDLKERAEFMLQQADNIECRKFITPDDVAVHPNSQLNFAFVTYLFKNYPSMPKLLPPEKEEEEAAAEAAAAEEEEELDEDEKMALEIEKLDESIKAIDEEEKQAWEEDEQAEGPEEGEEAVDVLRDTGAVTAEEEEQLRAIARARATVRESRDALRDAERDAFLSERERHNLATEVKWLEKEKEKDAAASAEVAKVYKSMKGQLAAMQRSELRRNMVELKEQLEEQRMVNKYKDWTEEDFAWGKEAVARERRRIERQLANAADLRDEEREALEEDLAACEELGLTRDRLARNIAAEKKRYDKKIDRAKKTLVETQASVDEHKEQLDQIQDDIITAESDTLDLERSKAMLDRQHARSTELVENVRRMLEQMHEDLDAKTDETDKTRAERRELSEKAARDIRSGAKLDAKIQATRRDTTQIKEERARLEEASEDLLNDISDKQTQTKIAQARLDEAQQVRDDAEQELDETIEDAQHDIDMAQSQARQDVLTQKRAAEVARKKEALKTAAKAQDLHDARSENATLAAIVEDARDESHQLAAKAVQARAEDAALGARLQAAEQRVADLKEDLDTTDAARRADAAEAAALDAQAAAHDKEARRQRRAAADAEAAARKADAQAADAISAADVARTEAEQDDASARRMDSEAAALQSEAASHENTLQDIEEEKATGLQDIEEARAKQSRQRRAAADKKIAKHKEAGKKAQLEKTLVEDDLKRQQQEAELKADERDDVARKVEAARKRKEKAEDENRESQACLKDLEKSISESMACLDSTEAALARETKKADAVNAKKKKAVKTGASAKSKKDSASTQRSVNDNLTELLSKASALVASVDEETSSKKQAIKEDTEEKKKKIRDKAAREKERKVKDAERRLKRERDKLESEFED